MFKKKNKNHSVNVICVILIQTLNVCDIKPVLVIDMAESRMEIVKFFYIV